MEIQFHGVQVQYHMNIQFYRTLGTDSQLQLARARIEIEDKVSIVSVTGRKLYQLRDWAPYNDNYTTIAYYSIPSCDILQFVHTS